MPEIGEIRNSQELGYKDSRNKRIWRVCLTCGKERWIQLRHDTFNPLCVHCAQKRLNTLTYSGQGTPKLGDTAISSTIGYFGREIRIWDSCPQCGDEHWQRRRLKGKLCPKCGIPRGGAKRMSTGNGRWAGGKRHANGYVFVTINIDHPFISMASRTSNRNHYQIAEHRLVMATHLGRPLTDDEIVHHINGIKSDNRIANLELLRVGQHHSNLVLENLQEHYRTLETKIAHLETRVTLLESENTLLRVQLELSGMLIPNQAEVGQSTSGVCRDLTGDILDNGMKGKSTLVGNYEESCCSRRQPQLIGVSTKQFVDKLLANQTRETESISLAGKAKSLLWTHANPELSGDSNVS